MILSLVHLNNIVEDEMMLSHGYPGYLYGSKGKYISLWPKEAVRYAKKWNLQL